MVFNEGCAYTQAFLMRTGSNQADSRNSVIHQFFGEFATSHILITNGEVEAIGYGLVEVFVIDYMETMTAEYLLQLMSSLSVDAYLLAPTT